MNAVQYWVSKARAMNWLCIWPRTYDTASRESARNIRASYMAAARRAKTKAGAK